MVGHARCGVDFQQKSATFFVKQHVGACRTRASQAVMELNGILLEGVTHCFREGGWEYKCCFARGIFGVVVIKTVMGFEFQNGKRVAFALIIENANREFAA